VKDRRVLYVQNRTHRAGAQTCLARLLRHDALAQWNPTLLCAPGGWLTTECKSRGIPVIEQYFPSSRSLSGRLFGNAAFASRAVRAIDNLKFQPTIVHANDHIEGLLGVELAKRLGARTAIFLRSPTMTRDDYFKYRCNEYDVVAAVGETFRSRVQGWDTTREIAVISDGIFIDEIGPPKPKVAEPPQRVLVLGSSIEWKGWADLTEALYLLEQENVIPEIEFDFTGPMPDAAKNNLKLDRLKKARCNFIGRVDAFRALVLDYDLAINPSRMETFGMAAVEVVAAGVPLLSSRTGVIEQVLDQPDILFPPGRPDLLAGILKHAFSHWDDINFGIDRGQSNIRARFLVDQAAMKLNSAYERLSA
jgi:glycosyltransferase involved in cell wall biosynthesis